jgi:uncharacterized protein YaaQ
MPNSGTKPENLIIAVVQSQDSDLVELVLNQENFKFTRLPSVGGFLRESNVTFLIGCPAARDDKVREILMTAAKKRVTFVSAPSEIGPLPIPIPTETMVGGVSMLTLDIEHFEEI